MKAKTVVVYQQKTPDFFIEQDEYNKELNKKPPENNEKAQNENKKYTITFIEDDIKVKRDFKRKIKEDFNIVDISLTSNINELIENIIGSKVKAVIVDYNLKENNRKIKYNGADVVEALTNEMPGFPSFVLTGHVFDAENKVMDVNIVYSKQDYFEKPKPLNSRIKLQIDHYLSNIDKISVELLELNDKKRLIGLTMKEEERLIELDDLLEQKYYNRSKLPIILKESKNIEKLDELIKKTDELIININKRRIDIGDN